MTSADSGSLPDEDPRERLLRLDSTNWSRREFWRQYRTEDRDRRELEAAILVQHGYLATREVPGGPDLLNVRYAKAPGWQPGEVDVDLLRRRLEDEERRAAETQAYRESITRARSLIGLQVSADPRFECERCGRLADVLDSATAVKAILVDRLDVQPTEWILARAISDAGSYRAAGLQRALAISFERAVAILEQAESAGIVRATPRHRGLRPVAACQSCLAGGSVSSGVTAIPPPRLVPPSVRFEVMRRDGFRCRYCGRSVEDGVKLHVDHVVPVAAGGTSDEGNLITACADCNLGKSDRPVL